MKLTHLLYFSFFSFLFSGCVVVKSQVDFNNDPEYHTKIKSAFVEVKDIKLSYFLYGLNDSLIANLKIKNVTIQSFKTDALSLDSEKNIQKQIKLLNPEVLIILERADTNIGRGRYTDFYDGGIYTMTIKLLKEDKTIWKATISTKNEYVNRGHSRIINQTTQQIIEKLQTDQLL